MNTVIYQTSNNDIVCMLYYILLIDAQYVLPMHFKTIVYKFTNVYILMFN